MNKISVFACAALAVSTAAACHRASQEQDNPSPSFMVADCLSRGGAQGRIANQIRIEKESIASGQKRTGCAFVHLEALRLAYSLMAGGGSEDALGILTSFVSVDLTIESERLFLVYVIAKMKQDREGMLRAHGLLTSMPTRSPYADLVSGIELCLQDRCPDAIPHLESANAALDNMMAQGYLAGAYAHGGRWAEAGLLVERFAPRIGEADTFVFYISVATYLQLGRRSEADPLFAQYITANPLVGNDDFVKEARRILSNSN